MLGLTMRLQPIGCMAQAGALGLVYWIGNIVLGLGRLNKLTQ